MPTKRPLRSREVDGEGAIIHFVVDRLPPMEAEERADVRSLASQHVHRGDPAKRSSGSEVEKEANVT